MKKEAANPYRLLPSVEEVLSQAEVRALEPSVARGLLAEFVAELLARWRAEIAAGELDAAGLEARLARGDLAGALAEVPTLREHGINTTTSNWRAIVGPKGLAAAQVSFWEGVLAKAVATEEWKKDLDANHWEGNFLPSAEFVKYLEADYSQPRAILTDLGMAK